ncbi:MAG: acyclic terpene utilization AtuA family protein [Phycisphaeraceae bacterium]
MQHVIRIGNAAAFWGDRIAAAAELAAQEPRLDVITMDYLAEVSMSILARQRARDAQAGFPADFIEAMALLAPLLVQRRREQPDAPLRVITNAGGLAPRACAQACARVLLEHGGPACEGMRIGIVSGDDVLPLLRDSGDEDDDALKHLESGDPLATVRDRLVTANVYLGAAPIIESLRQGVDIIITGRVADPSLTVAPCIWHHRWQLHQNDRIAGATVAGHLIECGTQVTGGISTGWLDVPDLAHIGYPIAEVAGDGSCVITKPRTTGGRVTESIVKEQLLYEIGDPDAYLSPDVTASFLSLEVHDEGHDRVRVSGAKGRAAPPKLKVSATYRAGYSAAGTLTIVGRDALAKAMRCAEVVETRLRDAGAQPRRWLVECLGSGGAVPLESLRRENDADGFSEIVLRLSGADERREVVEQFARELMPLVTCGPQGVTGYAEGRPRVHEVYGYWPCLIDRARVKPIVELLEVRPAGAMREVAR